MNGRFAELKGQIQDYKVQQVEAIDAAKEELRIMAQVQLEKNALTESLVEQNKRKQDKLASEIMGVNVSIARNADMIKTNADSIEYLRNNTVEEKVYTKAFKLLEQEQIRFSKRMTMNEMESKQFGNFFVRYLPVMI